MPDIKHLGGSACLREKFSYKLELGKGIDTEKGNVLRDEGAPPR